MMGSSYFTLLYVGSESCQNCLVFDGEWQKLEDLYLEGKMGYIPLELKKLKIEHHSQLPTGLRDTVSFYPFLFVVPTSYLEANYDREDFVMVGEALYAYKKVVNGKLEYKFCENVNDHPSMRYPRTCEGIMNWINDVALDAMNSLAPRFYPELVDPVTMIIRQRNLRSANYIDWKLESEQFSRDMMLIPSLNREYKISSGGFVLHKRIKNNH